MVMTSHSSPPVGTESGTSAELARIKKRVYPHLLRHSFATWQLSHGMNPIQPAPRSLVAEHDPGVYSHLPPINAAVLEALKLGQPGPAQGGAVQVGVPEVGDLEVGAPGSGQPELGAGKFAGRRE